MKEALVLFTGINFSHYMAEYAIDWAAGNKTSVLALFLRAGKEKEEGYFFPSDLDAAEKLTDRRDAERDDLILIKDYQKILDDYGKEKNVTVSSKILTDAPIGEIISLTRQVAIVFADATYDPTDVLSPKGFTLEGLQKRSHAPVEIIREP